jgi:cytidine deaminase
MTPDALVRAAQQARQHAHSPYSGYAVGAAVQTRSGKTFTGVNVENASSGLTVCAERVAIWKAVSEGEPDIVALAVVTEDGASPCGACRQVLHEFGPRATVYLADPNGATRETTAGDLLPDPFGPESLG